LHLRTLLEHQDLTNVQLNALLRHQGHQSLPTRRLPRRNPHIDLFDQIPGKGQITCRNGGKERRLQLTILGVRTAAGFEKNLGKLVPEFALLEKGGLDELDTAGGVCVLE